MCTEINPHINSKNRKLTALASACLALGLLLAMVFHPDSPSGRSLLHFVCGMLIGLSATINLSVVWKKSRQAGSGPRL
jgi:hypothetical protein